MTYTYV